MGSTLDPDATTPSEDRRLGQGHTTAALGPSDRSDTGSDVVGGPGSLEGEVLGLDRGTTSDAEKARGRETAGGDLGDANLDTDSDSGGTGERREAGRDLDALTGSDRGIDAVTGGEGLIGGAPPADGEDAPSVDDIAGIPDPGTDPAV